MSIQSYLEAKSLLNQNKSLLDVHEIGKKTINIINEAEKKLSIIFPEDYKSFLIDFGAISFGGQEIFGIVGENIEKASNANVVFHTLSLREEAEMPDYLIVIYNVGNGECFVLNYMSLNAAGKPRITSYWPGLAINKQTFEVIANDFGDFLLERVKIELNYNN